jgi:RHS repeat-associated protein
MKSVGLWKIGAVALLTISIFAPSKASAQGSPAQINEPHGDQPFGANQASNIDNIGFAAGSVDVRIPLFSRPGRGLPHQKFWTYTSKAWFQLQPPPCDPTVAQCPPPLPAVWAYADYTDTFSSILQYRSSGCSDGHMHNERTNYTYVDQFGAPHVFDAVTPSEIPPPNCIHPKTVGYSLDNSGMRLDTSTGIITLKDGTTVGTAALFKDANGNTITTASSPNTGEYDTLGRNVQHLTGTLSDGAQYEDWITQDSQGNPQKTRIEWASVAVCTNFQQGDTVEACGTCINGACSGGSGIRVARAIDLPDGLAYKFTYDTGTTPGHYGELLRIDLPWGGYIRYEYAPVSASSNIYKTIRAITKRTVSADGTAASEKVWTYQYQLQVPDTSHNTTLVTDPDGNQTAHVIIDTFFAIGSPVPLETETRYYQGSSTSGTLLRKVQTDYAALTVFVGDADDPTVTSRILARPVRVTTTLDNGLTSKVETDYDAGPDNNGVISFSRSNVVEKREFDYGQNAPGPLVRRTDYTYLHNANSAYAAANIVDRVLNTTVYDGANNIVAQTQNVYDEGTLTNTNTAATCQSPSGAPNHDYCNFGTGNLLRGNVTSVKRWRNTDSTWLTTTHTYDDLGNPLSTTDPAGNVTNYSYSDSWSGANCVPAGVNTYAFVTQIKNALNQRTQATYFSCPGLVQSKRDENDIAAKRDGAAFTYDGMNRVLTTTLADGGQTRLDYHGDALPFTVTKTVVSTPNPNVVSSTVYDGLGRMKTASLDSDPVSPDFTDTTYDNLGRKATVSNPHRSKAATTDGITTYQYDALGRTIQVAPPDGTVPTAGSTCLANNVCTSYSGNAVTATDQAGKPRRSISDALGRMIEVHEPGDPYPGSYSSGGLGVSGTLQSFTTGAHGATTAGGSVSISGTENSATDFNDPNCYFLANGLEVCPTVYNSGSVWITVNGFTASVGYDQGATTANLASSLVNALNVSGSPVHASLSGSTVRLTTIAAGSSANYALSAGSSTDNPGLFGGPSFTAAVSGSTLTGGADAFAGNTTYDYGTVTATVGGVTATACYGPNPNSVCGGVNNSTAAQVAAALAGSGPNGLSRAGSPVHASASGSSLVITWNSVGAAGNVSVSCSGATQSSSFSSSSFTCPASTALTGGTDPEGPSLDHNFFVTLYAYDALDNLLSVTQKGDPAATTSSQWRARSFTYNSLSELLTSQNPETGTISYSYDAVGNMLTKTDARSLTTSYRYDALNRLTQESYSDGSAPRQFYYDVTPPFQYNAPDHGSSIGRLTHASNDNGAAYDPTYDAMGRVIGTRYCIPSDCNYDLNVTAAYDLAGNLTKLTYPNGETVSYTPDSAGRMVSAIDTANGLNFVSGATYGPDGGLTGFVSGKGGSFAGVTNSFSYNNRLQPVNMSATTPSATVLSLNYDFHLGVSDNGDVWGIINNKDTTRNQTFTYDPLNRLASAQNAGTDCSQHTVNGATKYWGNNYGYDPWGNLLSKTVTKCSAENLSVTVGTNNQLQGGYTYDAAGNMTYDATGGHHYAYDVGSRITSIDSGAASYLYDADGMRVRKDVTGAPSTEYAYFHGQLIAEKNVTSGAWTNYIFFGGERVARNDPGNTVSYYFSDHLKTTDVVTDAQGNIKNESDFYAWGGELQFSTNDSNHYKFTGKERDSETGLDYFGARYYSNGLGRFITPDWAAKPAAVPYAVLGNPQSLNLYAYVLNLPTIGMDVDGHAINHEFDWSPLNAGPNKDEGGPNSTVAAQTLARMQSAAFGWQGGDIPPPPPPPAPGVPAFAFDQARINTLTVTQVAGIVFNENRDVFPGDSTPQQLQEAKTAQAHAIINGDRALGADRPQTASTKVSKAQKESAQYQQALTAARSAYQEAGVGKDPTGGRIYYNNRFEPQKDNLHDPRKGDNHLVQDVFHVYGAFTVGGGKVWTIIYDNYRKE